MSTMTEMTAISMSSPTLSPITIHYNKRTKTTGTVRRLSTTTESTCMPHGSKQTMRSPRNPCTPPLGWWNRVSYGWMRNSHLANTVTYYHSREMRRQASEYIIHHMVYRCHQLARMIVLDSHCTVRIPNGYKDTRRITRTRHQMGRSISPPNLSL